ncbi:DUF3139 domain-containing protein [Pseudobacillus sp. FSL P4-0506]|uniref:DUF3139 domain-containing protein n=1 Tax=unclassified Pseudobacillus TaxID=2619284 RepID=UPI0030FC9BDD
MRKKLLLSLFIFALMISGAYYMYWTNKQKEEKEIAISALHEYLYKEKSYRKKEIKKITFFNDNPLGGKNYLYHYAYVVYQDEPKNEYVYYITKHKEVVCAGFAKGDISTMKHEIIE